MSGAERLVRPHPKGGWEVRAPGAARTSGRFQDRDTATQRARDIVARQGGGRVVVQDDSGATLSTLAVDARPGGRRPDQSGPYQPGPAGDPRPRPAPADPAGGGQPAAPPAAPDNPPPPPVDAGPEPVAAAAVPRPAPVGTDVGQQPDGSLAGLAAKTAADVRQLVAAEARLIRAGLRHELRRLVVTGGAAGATALLNRIGHGRGAGSGKLRS